MTDHSPLAAGPAKADLLVIGGLTIDEIGGTTEAAGGAARHATEGALAAGLRVALHTVAGNEPVVRDALEQLANRADVIRHPAATSIRFEHHGTDSGRRLRLRATTDPLQLADVARLPTARAVLFAPVAGEISAEAVTAVRAPFRAAGLQGWLRATDPDGWVLSRSLADVDPALTKALRGLDLLIASHQDLGLPDGPEALDTLRAWAGPSPALVITAGADGAWLDEGAGRRSHVAAQVVEGFDTIGAGDAFAAVLVARRGAGLPLVDAAAEAASATAHFLATRVPPRIAPVMPLPGLTDLDGTAWRAVRFGPGLSETPPEDAEFFVQVEGDRVFGRSGCNRYFGAWAVEGDHLRIGPLGSTMMYCFEPIMVLERAFLEALGGATGTAREDDRLLFIGPDGTPQLELVPSIPEKTT